MTTHPTAPHPAASSAVSDQDVAPKPEYPRPQLVRPNWLNLNGTWSFEIDAGDSGLERGLVERDLGGRITVPFAPESEASGLGHTDFMAAVWYRRTVTIPREWAGRRVLLHFGAVDHDATVWANGVEVGRHRGGFSSFTLDLTDRVRPGEEATLVVRARDLPHEVQARGKQALRYANTDCHYTRTTGIWQTVWLEPVPQTWVRRLRVTPQLAASSFTVTTVLGGARDDDLVAVARVLGDDGSVVAERVVGAGVDLSPTVELVIPTEQARVWSPQDPYLYGLRVELRRGGADGEVVDAVDSYAGLRSVTVRGRQVLLNGRPVFQRLVLDQGYWPQSLMTSPSDEATVRDIELSMAAGFTGARLHQKVFEERFYYHADRLGYLVWGEFGDWGCSGRGPRGDDQRPTASYITQWLEVLERDHNHPSLIGWCPLNETHQLLHDRTTQLDDVTRGMFLATKLADPSRPVLDASGYSHRVPEADIYDSHLYEQQPAAFAELVGGLAEGEPYVNTLDGQAMSIPYAGQPYFVSEYGGIWWNPELAAGRQDPDRRESWGYGERVRTEEEFHERFAGLTNALLDDPEMFGYCYTQLTDTFQEQNGIYRFDRSEKLDVARVRAVQARPAAYESTDR